MQISPFSITNFIDLNGFDVGWVHVFIHSSIPTSCRSPMQIDGKLDQRGGYNAATCLSINWWFCFWQNLCTIAYADTCNILDLSPLLYFNIQGLIGYLSIHQPDLLSNICLHTVFVDNCVHGPIVQSLYSRLISTWSSDDLDNLVLLCIKPSPHEKRSHNKISNRKSQENKNKNKAQKRHKKKSQHESSSSFNFESISTSTDEFSLHQWFSHSNSNFNLTNKLLLLINYVLFYLINYPFLYLK